MATTAPLFEEHTAVGKIGEKGPHADLDKLKAHVNNIQKLETMEGVLAVHVAIALSLKDGSLAYVHHFRTVDKASRERVHLAAHEVHAKHLVQHCEVSRDLLGKVEDPRSQDHHSHFHKLSSARMEEAFSETAHLDWEARPIGSHAAKFPAVRIVYMKYKVGTPQDVIKAHHQLLASLPSKFDLIKQVSFGENNTEKFVEAELYAEKSIVHWDIGAVFGFASAMDMAALDSIPEYIQGRDSSQSLFESLEVFDICLP